MKSSLFLSLKGGTGKSFVTTQTAFELVDRGYNVGIIDADIASPNIGEFLNIDNIDIDENTEITPVELFDGKLQVFSMSGLAQDRSINMNESGYANLLDDVITKGKWNSDILLIDMPAGSSDILKSVVRILSDTIVGNVVVAHPAHSKDAERVLKWHQINGVNVLGIIENMAYFRCNTCNNIHYIFGESNIEELANEYNTTYLGSIPLTDEVRRSIINKTKLQLDNVDVFIKLADKLEHAEVTKPGFLSAIVKYSKDVIRDTIIKTITNFFTIANTEVPIQEIANKHGYKGNRDIRLDIVNEDGSEVIQTIYFILKNGRLLGVPADKAKPEVHGIINVKALAYALLGYIPRNGKNIKYNLFDAYLNGDFVVYSNTRGDMLRTLKFMKDTWSLVSVKENGRLSSLLSKVV